MGFNQVEITGEGGDGHAGIDGNALQVSETNRGDAGTGSGVSLGDGEVMFFDVNARGYRSLIGWFYSPDQYSLDLLHLDGGTAIVSLGIVSGVTGHSDFDKIAYSPMMRLRLKNTSGSQTTGIRYTYQTV